MEQMVLLLVFFQLITLEEIMYKLLSINDALMTRDIELKNLETGTTDICFDDSVLVSDTNFEFMELGKEYDCKIKLFGEITRENGEDIVNCNIVKKDVLIGDKSFICVSVRNDIYYVYQEKVENSLQQESFLFDVSRKDIIQVDDVIHNDLL